MLKEKVQQLKEKIMNNKPAAIALVVLVLVLVGILVFVLGDGGSEKGKKDGDSQKELNVSTPGEALSNDKNKGDKNDKKPSSDKNTDEKADGEDESAGETSSGETGEETGSEAQNQNGSTSGSTGGNTSGNKGGSTSGNKGGNTSGSTGGSTGGSTSGSTGGNTSGSTGGNTSGSTGGSTGGSTSGSTGGSTGGTSSGKDTVQKNQNAMYQQLFDLNNKITIRLDISDDQLKLMQSDYKSGKDTYRMVNKMTVTIGGTSYELNEVGVRIKGNTSRVDVINGGNVNDRNLIHMRLKFNETFDGTEYGSSAKKWSSEALKNERKNRTFATLKGLELKWNRNFDSTYVTNCYANYMFKALGVYAQSTSLANIVFGGYNYGVYTIYEPVDTTFIKKNFQTANQGGDLYKCAWGEKSNGKGGGWSGASYLSETSSSIGVEATGKSYIYELKTNKKKSNHSMLKKLITTLNGGSVTKANFGSVVEADNWVKFAAASYFVGNPDDMRNNNNNHYVYMMPNGKAIFIPYDTDRCFGITTSGKDMASFSPFAEDTALAGKQSNALYKASVITRNNNYTQEYKNALKTVAESGWMNYANYKKYYDMAYRNYSSVAIPDSNVHIYVKDFNSGNVERPSNSSLAFAESNSSNTSVKDYMSKIMNTYTQAMNK